MRKAFALPTVAIAAAAFPLLTMSAASADSHGGSYQGDLGALNDSGVTGTAMVTLDGNQATVVVDASGLLAGSPHAQHFHIGAEGTCPPAGTDDDGDGFLSTTEGAPFYGAIGASLTTEGDTSPESGLAVDRFPTADDGTVSYERTFEVSDDVAASFEAGTAVYVIHGVDKDGSGAYDGDIMSDLTADLPEDQQLPMEATAPAACGPLTAAQMGTTPSGGAETGAGSTSGVEEQAAIAVGSVALVGAAAAGAVAYRRRQTDSV